MSWGGRYLSHLLGRSPGRNLLSLLLALLLALAFGLLTVLRGIYAEAYKNVEVQAVFYGGLPYPAAQKLEKSGMVRDPRYEFVFKDGDVDFKSATMVFTNDLGRYAPEVDWLEGWDEAAFNASEDRVCILPARYAEALEKGLGDAIRVEEHNYLDELRQRTGLLYTEEEFYEALDIRDQRRPQLAIVGLIVSASYENTAYIPVTAWKHFYWIANQPALDLAEYTLADYHRAAEFSEYAGEVLSRVQNLVKLELDTSYADRIYSIHQLIETLYPLTIAAALLLGGVLPGLTVLHAAKEISVLRALGAKVGSCMGLYTAAQVLCAMTGLLLGMALVLFIQKPELNTVVRPFGFYLAAHLAACAVGSGVFAWLCARKHVLAQLQAKE